MQNNVLRVEGVVFNHPGQTVDHAPVLIHHAFGLTGRAGGVDNIRQMMTFQTDVARVDVVCRTLLPRRGFAIQFDQVNSAGLCRQEADPGVDRLAGDQHRRLAVIDHIGQPLLWIIRVQRHISAPGFQGCQQGDNQFMAALQSNTDPAVRPHALLPQPPGQLVGPAVQLTIAERLTVKRQRCRFWLLASQRFKRQVDIVADRARELSGIPVLQNSGSLAGDKQLPLADRLLLMLVGLSDKTKQTMEMTVQIRGAVQSCIGIHVKFKTMLTEVGDGDGQVIHWAEGQIVLGGVQTVESYLA